MAEILSLSMPFFGLIFLGYAAGRIMKIPVEGLAWLNAFIIYFALPALFFQLLSQTPFDELTNGPFIFATTFSTYLAFAIAFTIGALVTRGNISSATIQGVAGSYSNIGYMGPGLTLAALGPQATVPTALIVLKRVFLHPFIMATIAGVIAAYFQFQPPGPVDQLLTFLRSAAAPAALFAMGVTVALRPLKRVPWELPGILFVKLIIHPIIVVVMLNLIGVNDPVWVSTAILMAALPPALNVFILAQQYDTYVQRASSSVLIGTVVSVFTVTAVLFLVKEGLVPTNLFGS